MIDAGSGTGKTAVCDELQRRGYHAAHGDRELRCEPEGPNERHLPPRWDVAKVEAVLADRGVPVRFLCGGCRNSSEFVDRLCSSVAR